MKRNRRSHIFGALCVAILLVLLLSHSKSTQVDSVELTIVLNGIDLRIMTERGTVGEVLRESQIDIFPEDLVIPDLTESISNGETIYIYPATEVFITNFYGDTHPYRTRSKTVGAVMGEIGYEQTEEEAVHPNYDTLVHVGLDIYMVRTTEDILEVEVSIPHRTKYVRDATKDYLFKEIQEEGKDGMKKKYIQLKYENDELIDRVTLNEEILEEPVTEIILIGTATPPGGTSLGTTKASFYGEMFHGRRTASGDTFDMNELTAAHKKLPFGAIVKVTNNANGESVVVRITDRGPYAYGRGIDLSKAAFGQISHLGAGVISVEMEVVNN